MGSMWTSLQWVMWSSLVLFNFTCGLNYDVKATSTKALQNAVAEPRGRHRLQLLFPLLLRISTRLAALVPTAFMGLLGIILFVAFSKKALIISLLALFISLSGKYNAKNEDIYIHKVDSYPDYNDEEHIHYHHHGPPKYKKHFEGYHPSKKWKKNYKRTISSLTHLSAVPLGNGDNNVKPFKPLFEFQKRADLMRDSAIPVLFPLISDEENQNLLFKNLTSIRD